MKQLSGRRETKILRKGSNKLDCSVVTPAATSSKTNGPIGTCKQQSLFDTLSVLTPEPQPTEATSAPSSKASSKQDTLMQCGESKLSPAHEQHESLAQQPRLDTPTCTEVNAKIELQTDSELLAESGRGPTSSLSDTGSDDEVQCTGVIQPTLTYATEKWLQVIGGNVTDVEANGQGG